MITYYFSRTMKHCLPALTVSMLVLKSLFIHASSPSAQQTKQQLNQLEGKVDALNRTLNQAETTRHALSQTLAGVEKQIGEHIHTLHGVKIDLDKKQQAVQDIQKKISIYQQQLHAQQEMLANHLRTRYQMSKAHPLQWLINQDNPQKTDRFMMYYRYLIRADQDLVQKIRLTTQTLQQNQDALKQESASLSALQQTLVVRQKKLMEAKQEHHHVIQSLNQSIQTKQQVLAGYRRDQVRLQALLDTLARAAEPEPNPRPTTAPSSRIQFRAKFSNPLGNNGGNAQPRNQGMMFLAKEGTPVTAILPGKIVFSDWLNGYGLLMIIDHGQGMMSLYAHNESLFKSKGDKVNQGDQIATVGHTGGLHENGLYFELRRRGMVIPPRQWLS